MGAHSERGVSCGCGSGRGVLGPSIVQRERSRSRRAWRRKSRRCFGDLNWVGPKLGQNSGLRQRK
eukprot:2304104-Prymnesium_polylepis.1